jgi:hypothetical protein
MIKILNNLTIKISNFKRNIIKDNKIIEKKKKDRL